MAIIQIVTDSTADIPTALAEELNITIVPCEVYLGKEVYQDRVGLTPEVFFAKLAQTRELPRTAHPPVSQFLETYRRLLDDRQVAKIMSVHVASNLSGTVNAAWAASQMLTEPGRVEVIDSGQLSMGLGWAVIEAARAARTSTTAAEVSQHMGSVLPRLRTAAMIDTLDNLYRGGRISQISAALGTALRIKPLLSIQEGQVYVWGKVRTRSRALQRLTETACGWSPLAEIAVMHTGAENLAQTLAQALQALAPADGIMVSAAGPALATHLGLGAVGVCAVRASCDQTHSRETLRAAD